MTASAALAIGEAVSVFGSRCAGSHPRGGASPARPTNHIVRQSLTRLSRFDCPAWVFATAPLTRCPGADVMLTPPRYRLCCNRFRGCRHRSRDVHDSCCLSTSYRNPTHSYRNMLCSNVFPRYQFLGAGALISSRHSGAPQAGEPAGHRLGGLTVDCGGELGDQRCEGTAARTSPPSWPALQPHAELKGRVCRSHGLLVVPGSSRRLDGACSTRQTLPHNGFALRYGSYPTR